MDAPGFDRVGLDGKACLARFTKLIEAHKNFNSDSHRASGIDEEYNEKLQLLDELLAIQKDWCDSKKLIKEEEREKKDDDKKKAEVIRDQAMSRLKHKIDDEDEEDHNTTKKKEI
jgi:hypothetical protein